MFWKICLNHLKAFPGQKTHAEPALMDLSALAEASKTPSREKVTSFTWEG